jgi:hypothetical protein
MSGWWQRNTELGIILIIFITLSLSMLINYIIFTKPVKKQYLGLKEKESIKVEILEKISLQLDTLHTEINTSQ